MKYAIARNGCYMQQQENYVNNLQQALRKVPIDALDLEAARYSYTPEYIY